MTPPDERLDLAQFEDATPGPWAWESTGEKENSWSVGRVVDDDDRPLSGEVDEEGTVEEGVAESIVGNFANARLIAAAPALLQEVRELRAKARVSPDWEPSEEMVNRSVFEYEREVTRRLDLRQSVTRETRVEIMRVVLKAVLAPTPPNAVEPSPHSEEP